MSEQTDDRDAAKTTETRPLRKDLSPDEIQRFIEEQLRKLRDEPSGLEEAARLTRLPADQLRAALEAPVALVSARRAAGFTGAEAAVIVAFAPLVVHIGKSIWDNLILPQLQQKF